MRAAILLLILTGCATVPQGHSFNVTEQQMETCDAQGGCVLVTRVALAAIAKRAAALVCGKGI